MNDAQRLAQWVVAELRRMIDVDMSREEDDPSSVFDEIYKLIDDIEAEYPGSEKDDAVIE